MNEHTTTALHPAADTSATGLPVTGHATAAYAVTADGAATMGPAVPAQPLRHSARFDGTPGSVCAARGVTTRFLHRLEAEWCARVPERTAGDLHLVVSELATNAERHAGGFHRLDLTGDAQHVVVTVHDTNPVAPSFLAPDPTRVGGHGLEIVRALSREVRIARTPGGKSVGAVIDLPH